MAKLTLAILNVFFNWCLDRELITISPTARVKISGKTKSRERTLSLPNCAGSGMRLED
jgi:hypothetical protein